MVDDALTNVSLAVEGVNLPQNQWGVPTISEYPLFVDAPVLYRARINQATYFPAAENMLYVEMQANVVIGASLNARIEISNLVGALNPSGTMHTDSTPSVFRT